MDFSNLDDYFSTEELQTLSADLKAKISQAWKEHEELKNVLKNEAEKVKAESDKKCSELDSQLLQLQERAKLDKEQLESLLEAKSQLEDETASAKQTQIELEAKIVLLENLTSNLQQEKENISTTVASRDKQLEDLNSELTTLKTQLAHSREQSTLVKAEELKTREAALESREKRFEQERETLAHQQQFLQNELEQRTKEILLVRQEMNKKWSESENELAEKNEEISGCKRTISELSSARETLSAQISRLQEELEERNANESRITESHRQELRSQAKLCELYRVSSEEALAKVELLSKANEELQQSLKQTASQLEELETSSSAKLQDLTRELEQKADTITTMKKELERAHALLEATKANVLSEECIEAMSPSVAAASRLLKSGMSLTQIFSQYVAVSEQLLQKEEENKRLSTYIDQIVQEIENRAPTIARQQEDYQKSIELVASLSRQLELAAEEAESERRNAQEARRLSNQLEQSNLQHRRQVDDLSAQVRRLVQQVELLRGNQVVDQPDGSASSTDGSPLEPHLITFSHIDELQAKNQQLLQILRQVTDKQEEAEKNAVDTRTARIQRDLDKALAEIQILQDSKRRLEELMESVVQQREMYRKLVEESGSSGASSASKAGVSADQRGGGSALIDLQKRLDQMQSLYEQSQQKCQLLIRENASKERQLRDELNDQKTRLTCQIQFMEEKERLLKGNLESLKNQLNAVEQKNQIYASTVAKHEQSIAILRDEAMKAQQQLARSEVTIVMLAEEKQLLEDTKRRLLVEKDVASSVSRNQNLLSVNLESIKLNLEREEAETEMRLENALRSVEQLRHQLETIEERHRQALKSLEERLESQRAAAIKLAQERAAQAQKAETKLQELLKAVECRSRQASPIKKGRESDGPTPTGTIDSDQSNDLRTQLMESRNETEKMRQEVERLRHEWQMSRDRAARFEDELQKANGAAVAAKQQTDQMIVKLTKERDTLSQTLEQVQAKLKQIEEGAAIIGQASSEPEGASLKISHLELQLSAAEQKMKQVLESEAKLERDLSQQMDVARQTQEKYERELVEHAAAVAELKNSRVKLDEQQRRAIHWEQTVSRLQEELKAAKSTWQVQRSLLEQRAGELASRCAELDKQVELMEQQMGAMSAQLSALKSTDDSNRSLNVSIGEEDTQSSEQLMELIRSLRRQKEIAVSRYEVSEAETRRLEAQLERSQRQLVQVQSALGREQERSSSLEQSQVQSIESRRQLEMLNALTDSNRLLREERAALASQKEELSAKVNNLEQELEPLRQSSRQFNQKVDELTAENQTLRKQVVAWRSRTNSLQQTHEKALGTWEEKSKRLEQDKDHLHKELDEVKEQRSKLAGDVNQLQETRDKLVVDGQKQQEENVKLKEQVEQLQERMALLQNELSAAEAKRKEEEAKANEKIEPLRRIARKYKAQFEELKTEHDKLVAEKAAASAAKEDSDAATAKAQLEQQYKDLENKHGLLTGQLEQLKKDHEALQSADEKTKAVLKSARLKIANLQKEKEGVANELTEAKNRIETLEQGSEESNDRSAALRSQLEGRLARLERENGELTRAKQALTCELELVNQRLSLLQRQETFQKQEPVPAEKATNDNPPTANIRPMTSSIAQRPSPTGTQASSSVSPVHRTTPTASIRPMGMVRTAAVPPTSLNVTAVSAMSPTHPTPTTSAHVNDPEPVPSTSRTEDESDHGRKRTRPAETTLDPELKRVRVGVDDSEEEPTRSEDFELVVEEESDSIEAEQATDPIQNEPEDLSSTQRPQLEPPVLLEQSVNEPIAPANVPEPLVRPIREDRLLPIGRNTVPYEDSTDDGIVPSTPILLRPRTNDGFAEAVVSPQVNSRFVFGSIPDLSVVPSGSGAGNPEGISDLVSQGMVDTRMDLTQLAESTGRSVPSTPVETSPDVELTITTESEFIIELIPVQESTENEPAPVPVDAGASHGQEPAGTIDEAVDPETNESSQLGANEQSAPSSSPASRRDSYNRRGRGSRPRGRGLSRADSGTSARPIPITWSADGQQSPVQGHGRGLRSATSPAPVRPVGSQSVPESGLIPSPRGRGRGRPRGPRHV